MTVQQRHNLRFLNHLDSHHNMQTPWRLDMKFLVNLDIKLDLMLVKDLTQVPKECQLQEKTLATNLIVQMLMTEMQTTLVKL